MAMPFYEGPTLKAALAELGHAPSEAQLRAWLTPLLDALTVMHAAQCFHRDIAPDNILLTATGPLLLDFGAARRVIGDMTHALTVVLKPGYAPIEQYGDVASMTQGAWTDIYALACVVYFAITGRTPMSSVERLMDDRLQPLAVEAKGRYGDGFLRAIDAALAVRPQDRPQNAAQFRALLDIDLPTPPPSPPQSGYGALSHEPFPATQDSGYSTVPGTLTPELATQVQARAAEPTVPPPAPAVESPPAIPPAAAPAVPAQRVPAPEPVRREPGFGSAPRAVPQAAPALRRRPSASSKTLVLGARVAAGRLRSRVRRLLDAVSLARTRAPSRPRRRLRPSPCRPRQPRHLRSRRRSVPAPASQPAAAVPELRSTPVASAPVASPASAVAAPASTGSDRRAAAGRDRTREAGSRARGASLRSLPRRRRGAASRHGSSRRPSPARRRPLRRRPLRRPTSRRRARGAVIFCKRPRSSH